MDREWCDLRVATAAETAEDLATNPIDLWFLLPLGLAPESVRRAATDLWGSPGRSVLDGELLWRLRWRDGDQAVYLSVDGVGGPVLMFNACDPPDLPKAEALVADVTRLLRGRARGDGGPLRCTGDAARD